MLNSLILLSFLSLTAQAQDPLGLFEQSFSPLIEAEINKFTFEQSEEPKAPKGDFSFKSFRFVAPSTQASLDNQSQFYDSKVYYNGDLFGFKGPAASFVYKLRDTDKDYFNTLEWLNVENAYFLMNEEEISLKGEKLAQKGTDAFIFASNFKLDCDRHQNFLHNDGDGFLSGCLNSGIVKPLTGPGVGTEYHFYDETKKKIIDVKSYISEVQSTQNSFSIKAISANANFSDEVAITGSELKIDCEKSPDLLSVGVPEFVIPCLKNIKGKGSVLEVKYLQDNDQMVLTSPTMTNALKDFQLTFEKMKYQTLDSNFSLSSSKLDCLIPEGDILEVETYLKGCLNGAALIPFGNRELDYEFNQKEEGDEPLELKMQGKIGQVQFTEDEIILDSSRTSLAIDNEIFLILEKTNLICQKEEGIEKFEAKSILDNCKKKMILEPKDVKIKDFADAAKPIVAAVKVLPMGAVSQNGVLNLKLDQIKLADKEDLTLMKDVDVDCSLLEGTDVFIPNDIIEACSVKGDIKIKNLFTEDSTLSVGTLKGRDFDLNKIVIPEKKAKIYDIHIQTNAGKLHVEVGMRVLGIKSTISFSGPVKWHKEKEMLEIKVENTRLPLGIKSRGILMFFLRKMLVAEMIDYKDDGKIEISL